VLLTMLHPFLENINVVIMFQGKYPMAILDHCQTFLQPHCSYS